MRRLVLTLAAALIGGVLIPVLPASAAVAPGCTSARPTSVGGPVYGSDNRSLNVFIGVELFNSSGQKVNPDGSRFTGGGYVYNQHLNPKISAAGSADTTLQRRWGHPSTGGVLCVSAQVTKVWVEMYPKDSAGMTSKVRYGSAAHHNQVLVAGGNHSNIALRLPVRFDLGGITGGVHGYLTYQGKAIDPRNITRKRVFPRTPGAQCGIEGFSASAEQVAVSSTGTKTYYKFDHLAGGKCGAATQRYVVQIDCLCGGVSRKFSREVDVASGKLTSASYPFG